MRKKSLLSITTLLLLVLLAGCGKPLDEQIEHGITNVETAFNEGPIETNTEIGKINVYLPTGYSVEESEDQSNYLVKKADHQFILFVNQKEQKNSRLLYGIFKENKVKEIVEEKTFENKDSFGFSAILQNDEETYELIVNIGGVKISTITSAQNIDVLLQDMMQIVHSVSY